MRREAGGQAQGDKPNGEIIEEGEPIGEKDLSICLYIEWLTAGMEEIAELMGRIRKDGLARVSVWDFRRALENHERNIFISWVEDTENRYWATERRKNEYHALYRRYACTVGRFIQAIRECLPEKQQAQQLATAIERLYGEWADAIERGTRQYALDGEKPQPAALLSDMRHGALWDNVENAIIALSAGRDETKAALFAAFRAGKRTQKGATRASDMKKRQRERAAKWLKERGEAGHYESIVTAVMHFEKEIETEKASGGYADKDSLQTALYNHAGKLGIGDFIKRHGNKRKGKEK